MKRIFALFVGLNLAAFANAQQLDNPISVSVSYYGEAVTNYTTGTASFSFGVDPSHLASASVSAPLGGTYVYSSLITASVVPGKEYTITVSSTNMAVVIAHFPQMPGYEIYLDGHKYDKLNKGPNYTFTLRVEAVHDMGRTLDGKRAGDCSSFGEDKATWFIGLGKLPGGAFAGSVGFRASSISSGLATTAGLECSADLSQVAVSRDGSGYITDVTSPDVKLITTTLSGTSYKIDVYQNSNLSTPFLTYTIDSVTVSGGAGLRIIKREEEGATDVYWTTRMEQVSGTWTLYDWRESDSSGNFSGSGTDKRTVASISGSTTTVSYGITNSYGTGLVVKQKNYSSGELSSVVWGPGVSYAPTTSYTYYTSSSGSGWAGAVESMVEPTGKWTKYGYFNSGTSAGLVQYVYHPWLDEVTSPASATTTNCVLETYTYTTGYTGAPQVPSSRVTSIKGTTVARTEWSYNFSYGSANSHAIAQTVQKDFLSSSSSDYLQTTTLSYLPDDSFNFFQGKPHSVTTPDATKTAYAYYQGTWTASTRSFAPGGGSDWLVLALHGQAVSGSGTTSVSTWTVSSTSWTIDTTYLVANLSTISETVIDGYGHTVFIADNIYTGSGMDRVSGMTYTYDGNDRLTKSLDIARTVFGVGSTGEVATNYAYSGGLLTAKTDADGNQSTYGYDNFLRNTTITSSAGGSGSYPAKTQTFTYNRADLKDTAQECSCGPTATTYSYEATGRLSGKSEPHPNGSSSLITTYNYDNERQTTVSLATGADLTTEIYYDGRVKAKTGSGQVATTYSYDYGAYATVTWMNHGSGGSNGWSYDEFDGLGRRTLTRTPQVGWNTGGGASKVVRKTYTYNAGGSPSGTPLIGAGRLAVVQTLDEAASNARLLPDHRTEYGNLNMVVKEGDDLGSNGALDDASTDRITTYETSISADAWGMMRYDYVRVLPTSGSGSDITVSQKRTRLTGFNNGSMSGNARALSDIVQIDASGRYSIAWVWSDATTRTRTQSSNLYGASNWSNTVWQDGYLASETSLSGVVKTSAYNSAGLLASVTESTTNAATSYTYYSGTSLVNTTTVTTGASSTATTTYAYYWDSTDGSETDAYKVKTTDAASNVSSTEYDFLGNPVYTWGSAARPTAIGYDSYGRRTTLTTYQGGSVSGSKWSTGSLTGAATTTWTLDAPTGAVTRKTYDDSSYVDYAYNPLGQLYTRTWARGVVTTYAYFDGSSGAGYVLTGELRQASYSDSTPTVSYTYNRVGELATVGDATGSRTLAYRTDLLLDTETLDSTFYGGKVLTQAYDGSIPGRPVGYSYNGNVTVAATWGYDSATGRLNSIKGTLSPYDVTFNLGYASGTDWVDSITSGSYFSRTQTQEAKTHVLDRVLTQWGSTVIGDFDSGFTDARGYRTHLDRSGSITFGGSTDYHRFSYNALGELNSEWSDQELALGQYDHHVVYDYDQVGNRNYQWDVAYGATYYTADSVNKYTSITSLNPESGITHDADGNLTRDGTWDYTYDGENRVSTMTRRDTTQALAFTYDYLGRRVRKVITGTGADDIKFVWNGWTLVAETTSNGYNIYYSFIWGPDFSNGQGAAGGAGSLLAIYSPGWNLHYAVPDNMGNVVGYLDASGNVEAAYEYTAYGQIHQHSGGHLPIGFAGQYTDRESGLVYYGLRYYNPIHGRFINRDPIEEAGGNNLYAFVGNAPTLGWDVLGECVYSDGQWWGVDCNNSFTPFGSTVYSMEDYLYHWGSDIDYIAPPPMILRQGSWTVPTIPANRGWKNEPWSFNAYETTPVPNAYPGTLDTPFGQGSIQVPSGLPPQAYGVPNWAVKALTPDNTPKHPELDAIFDFFAKHKNAHFFDPTKYRDVPQIVDPNHYEPPLKVIEFKEPFLVRVGRGAVYSVVLGATNQSQLPQAGGSSVDGTYPGPPAGPQNPRAGQIGAIPAGSRIANGILAGQAQAATTLSRFAFFYDPANGGWHVKDISRGYPGVILPESQAKEIMKGIFQSYGQKPPNFDS